MKSFRLNRLFNPKSNKCFDVAIDHGFFNVYEFLNGILDIRKAIEILVKANPDAIQLPVGNARHLQSIQGKQKPSLVMRSDMANVYGTKLPKYLFARMLENAAEQAVKLDASCVVVNLFKIPGQPEVTDHCIQNIMKLKVECERFSMPIMIEPLVFQPNEIAGGYMVDGNPEDLIPLVRQAVELGADIIKADPTDDASEYHRIIEVAGDVPVLVRGGGKVSDEEILNRTVNLMNQGAAGIVYGRAIIHHDNPFAMTKALMGIVHDNLTATEALNIVQNR
jgi:DhnA family fructose-bisphosphate aldolase class Ia